MDDLKAGKWTDDEGCIKGERDEQVADYDKLINRMEYVARFGEPQSATYVNYLEDGIWEFKAGRQRLAFYDTDGGGSRVPKPKITDIQDAHYPDPEGFWWFPELDYHLRLLNSWLKTSTWADPDDIELAISIAKEDVSHDR